MPMLRPSQTPNRVRFIVADRHRLTADALGGHLQTVSNWELVGTSTTQEGAAALARDKQPELAIVSPSIAQRDIEHLCRALQSAWPPLGILVLDDEIHVPHVREALRAKAAGYHTKYEPVDQIAEAARRVVAGQRSFCHDVATRLVDTSKGLRLRPHFRLPAMEKLTSREIDVLTCIARGETVKTCAETLGIRPGTVEGHKTRMMAKLGVHRAVELVRVAVQEKLIPERPRRFPAVEASTPAGSE